MPSFDVESFISQLQFDGARPNLFDVTIPFPTAVPNQTLLASFMVKAANLPSVDMGVATVPYFGRQIKLTGNKTFQAWTITVINDESFYIRDAFEVWSNNLNSHEGNVQLGSYGGLRDYGVNITINQYDKSGFVIKDYDMIGAWPSAISAIDMAWDDNNVVEQFQVTMEYQYWTARTTDSSGFTASVSASVSI